MSGFANGSALHFKTGVKGWLARFFVARRAAGDPWDATVVLPCMIFLAFALLNDRGHVGVPAVIAALLIPACSAGCWMGFCLGDRGIGRSILRGFFVGALEGGASVAIAKSPVGQPEALRNAFNLMYLNFLCFWFFAMLASTPSEILIQTEEQWQVGVRLRATIHRLIRMSLTLEDLKGTSTRDGILVWSIRSIAGSALTAALTWVWANLWGLFRGPTPAG